jgi:hypothetical protein
VLGTELETIPEPVDLSAAVAMGQPKQLRPGINVGLAWAGNPKHLRDSLRSVPLASLLPLRDIAECTFFNLQKDVPQTDQATLQAFGMERPLEGCTDFLDTAHALKDLDIVLSVDTAIAHLAATLHKRVWLILPEAADWRWGATGDTTPWYPTVKLFRRQPGEPTTRLVERLASALGEFASGVSSTAERSPERDYASLAAS